LVVATRRCWSRWSRMVEISMFTVEPDGGNLHVRIWEGLGWVTGRGYST
jgi:hypothetical protein